MPETVLMIVPEGSLLAAYRLGHKEGQRKGLFLCGIAIVATAFVMNAIQDTKN